MAIRVVDTSYYSKISTRAMTKALAKRTLDQLHNVGCNQLIIQSNPIRNK